MGTCSPYYTVPMSTYANIDNYGDLRHRRNVKQANEEASRPLYRNTTPTQNVEQAQPQQRPSQQNSTVNTIKQVKQVAELIKKLYNQYDTAQTMKAINALPTEITSMPSYVPPGSSEAAIMGTAEPAAASTEAGIAATEGAEAAIAAEAATTGTELGAALAAEGTMAGTEAGLAATAAGEAGTAAATGAEAGATAGGSASAGLGATGIGAIIAAITAAEVEASKHNLNRFVNPETGEYQNRDAAWYAAHPEGENPSDEGFVRTGNLFTGQGMNDPLALALFGSDKATLQEINDAYAKQGDVEGYFRTWPAAFQYWANPVQNWVAMAGEKYAGINNPIENIAKMLAFV